jgi:hypothetical protein
MAARCVFSYPVSLTVPQLCALWSAACGVKPIVASADGFPGPEDLVALKRVIPKLFAALKRATRERLAIRDKRRISVRNKRAVRRVADRGIERLGFRAGRPSSTRGGGFRVVRF